MKIQVKKTHIRRGIKASPDFCAIALAIKESLGVDKVQVRSETIKIGKKSIPLPEEVQIFITDFDDAKAYVEPFEFEL